MRLPLQNSMILRNWVHCNEVIRTLYCGIKNHVRSELISYPHTYYHYTAIAVISKFEYRSISATKDKEQEINLCYKGQGTRDDL